MQNTTDLHPAGGDGGGELYTMFASGKGTLGDGTSPAPSGPPPLSGEAIGSETVCGF